MTATETMSLAINLTEAFRDLVQIGIALTSERTSRRCCTGS